MIETTNQQIQDALDAMILSASGWRKVFAYTKDAEDFTPTISKADEILTTAIANVFAKSIELKPGEKVLAGMDARPTGPAISSIICKTLTALGAKVVFLGVSAAPEIMAESTYGDYKGFIYVSASHNPVGHNGIKFGFKGGVFGQKEVSPMIEMLKKTILDIRPLYQKSLAQASVPVSGKKEALEHYRDFVLKTCCPDGNVKAFIEQNKPIGIVADLNGSARGISIDKSFLTELGIKTKFINDKPGEIAHAIVPEGDNLKTCKLLLEQSHKEDPSFVLGYVPDNDGDRGNLVYIDNKGKAQILQAQEVFALCVMVALQTHKGNLAVAVNGPTSMRIDDLCATYGAKCFRSEVGEANAVNLADSLRAKGYNVPILGEGSNGGNITYPARVRDPMNTLMSMVTLLCSKEDITMQSAIESLPVYTTSNSFDKEAILHLQTTDFKTLKANYEKNFPSQWSRMESYLNNYGITNWKEYQTEGIVERQEAGNGDKGGLKIAFYNNESECLAFIWMRPSGTEPLFRILCDVKGKNQELHDALLQWQRDMILTSEPHSTNS